MPKDGATHSGLEPPTSIINQANSQLTHTGRSDAANSSVEFPSPQVTPVCVQETLKMNQYTDVRSTVTP